MTKAQSRYKIDPMTKLKTQLLELHELEHIHLDTVQEDGKRYYVDKKGERYPSVTTVTSLLTRDQIKLWRERVGEEKANKVSSRAARRGTKFHSLVEDYLRKEKDYIEFEDVMQEAQFKGIQPVLDEIVPIALEAPMYSENLKMAGRVDCIGMFDGILSIIDFKTSSKFKEDYMAIPWYYQMTAYAVMVEELTGHPIEEVTALVAMEDGHFQLFTADPQDYVEKLYDLRQQYRNLYKI